MDLPVLAVMKYPPGENRESREVFKLDDDELEEVNSLFI